MDALVLKVGDFNCCMVNNRKVGGGLQGGLEEEHEEALGEHGGGHRGSKLNETGFGTASKVARQKVGVGSRVTPRFGETIYIMPTPCSSHFNLDLEIQKD